MKTRKVDLWLGLLLLAFALAWSWMAYVSIAEVDATAGAGPQVFPVMLGLVLAGLSVLIALGPVLEAAPAAEPAPGGSLLREVRVAGSTFALFIGYGFLMEKVGFLVATPIVVAAAMVLVLRIFAWRQVLVMAFGLTIGCYVVFGYVMNAYLPRGTWIELG